MKRIFKGPWLWMVIAALGVLLAIQYLAPNDGYDEVTTSEMNAYIASGEVDGEERIIHAGEEFDLPPRSLLLLENHQGDRAGA